MVADHWRMVVDHGRMVADHWRMVVDHGRMVVDHGRVIADHGRMVVDHFGRWERKADFVRRPAEPPLSHCQAGRLPEILRQGHGD